MAAAKQGDTVHVHYTGKLGDGTVCGERGVRPTGMIGSMFYHGHDVMLDEDEGSIDVKAAEQLIRLQEDFSQRTGNPSMLDIVGATPNAIRRHLEFASKATDRPLLIDGTTAEVRLAGLAYAAEAGIADRVIYNSVTPDVHDDELKAIADAGVTGALVLTYYLLDFTGAGRVQAVRELAPRLREFGINRLIVDTCVLDLASMGEAMLRSASGSTTPWPCGRV